MIGLAAEPIIEDRGHVYRWNHFTDDLYELHKAQLAEHNVRTEAEVGGYAGRGDFYKEERFYDLDNGRLLSMIQWELTQPEKIHSIEVYRYDDQGRLSRDYSSTYLPDYRNAPTQTLIFVHRYNDDLHAYRSFDASGELLSERCEGEYGDEPVFINLDIDELDAAMIERFQRQSGPLTEPVYLRCFQDMPETAEAFLPPN